MRKKLKVCIEVSIDTSDPNVCDIDAKLNNLEILLESSKDFNIITRHYLAELLRCPELANKESFPDLLYFKAVQQDSRD